MLLIQESQELFALTKDFSASNSEVTMDHVTISVQSGYAFLSPVTTAIESVVGSRNTQRCEFESKREFE